MKRLITLLLAMVMALSLVVPAWAAEENLPAGGGEMSTEQDVMVTVSAPAKVYKVSITWESLDFTYSGGAWDTTNHVYTGGTWSTPATVNVENHSNAPIWYTAKLTTPNGLDAAFKNVNVTLNKESGNLSLHPVKVGDSVDTPADSFTVTVSGPVHTHGEISSAVNVRDLTVTISTEQPQNP